MVIQPIYARHAGRNSVKVLSSPENQRLRFTLGLIRFFATQDQRLMVRSSQDDRGVLATFPRSLDRQP
jgi:hypothetical protein